MNAKTCTCHWWAVHKERCNICLVERIRVNQSDHMTCSLQSPQSWEQSHWALYSHWGFPQRCCPLPACGGQWKLKESKEILSSQKRIKGQIIPRFGRNTCELQVLTHCTCLMLCIWLGLCSLIWCFVLLRTMSVVGACSLRLWACKLCLFNFGLHLCDDLQGAKFSHPKLKTDQILFFLH